MAVCSPPFSVPNALYRELQLAEQRVVQSLINLYTSLENDWLHTCANYRSREGVVLAVGVVSWDAAKQEAEESLARFQQAVRLCTEAWRLCCQPDHPYSRVLRLSMQSFDGHSAAVYVFRYMKSRDILCCADSDISRIVKSRSIESVLSRERNFIKSKSGCDFFTSQTILFGGTCATTLGLPDSLRSSISGACVTFIECTSYGQVPLSDCVITVDPASNDSTLGWNNLSSLRSLYNNTMSLHLWSATERQLVVRVLWAFAT
eukprot:Rmarinus@m.10760